MRFETILCLTLMSFASACKPVSAQSDVEAQIKVPNLQPGTSTPSSVTLFTNTFRSMFQNVRYVLGQSDCSNSIRRVFEKIGFFTPQNIGLKPNQIYKTGINFDYDMKSSTQGYHYFTTCKGEILAGDVLHIRKTNQSCESEKSHFIAVSKQAKNSTFANGKKWYDLVAEMQDMSVDGYKFYQGPVRSSLKEFVVCDCIRHVQFQKHWDMLRSKNKSTAQNSASIDQDAD